MIIRIFCFIVVLILSLSLANVLKAQDCVEDFVEEVLNVWHLRSEKFDRQFKKAIKNFSRRNQQCLAGTRVLHIPILFSTREGSKKSGERDINQKNLFCYIDTQSMRFDESIFYSDTVVLGIIVDERPLFPIGFRNDIQIDYYRPLFNTIMKNNPDVIFKIYNIPRRYWYVKENELFVISLERMANEVGKSTIHKPKPFNDVQFEKDEFWFLSHRRVIVISGRLSLFP